MATTSIAAAVAAVRSRIVAATAAAGRAASAAPRLVAVSKVKPASDVLEAYEAGQRVFGESYVQEVVDKAPKLPGDIQWHFIGHLQSNKVKKLVKGVPNLAVVETVDSEKLANTLNKAVAAAERDPLRVFVQVNTSLEAQKSGTTADGAVDLAAHIKGACPNLTLAGFMTIGKLGETATEFFVRLCECRAAASERLGVPEDSLELSMGMSADFELAIECGSTNVRVGSTIFGERDATKRAAELEADAKGDEAAAPAVGSAGAGAGADAGAGAGADTADGGAGETAAAAAGAELVGTAAGSDESAAK